MAESSEAKMQQILASLKGKRSVSACYIKYIYVYMYIYPTIYVHIYIYSIIKAGVHIYIYSLHI